MSEHDQFCKEHLGLSPVLRTEDELVEHCDQSKYDLIIVGSDAVFRLSRTELTDEGGFPNPFWMMWTLKLKSRPHVAALAASCTGSMYLRFPRGMKKGIKAALANFDRVTVRDRWTRWMLSAVTHGRCRPTMCPDPVFGLNGVLDAHKRSAVTEPPSKKPYLLVTLDERALKVLGHHWVEGFTNAAREGGFDVCHLPIPEGCEDLPVDHNIPLPIAPLDWYRIISQSAGLVGTRFHPIVSCIANSVPFVSIDNNLKRCMGMPVRLRSKQYDLCVNAKIPSNCLAVDAVKRLGPQGTYSLLQSCRREQMDDYRQRAATQFRRTLEEIVALS
jgi:hypothetical protein